MLRRYLISNLNFVKSIQLTISESGWRYKKKRAHATGSVAGILSKWCVKSNLTCARDTEVANQNPTVAFNESAKSFMQTDTTSYIACLKIGSCNRWSVRKPVKKTTLHISSCARSLGVAMQRKIAVRQIYYQYGFLFIR